MTSFSTILWSPTLSHLWDNSCLSETPAARCLRSSPPSFIYCWLELQKRLMRCCRCSSVLSEGSVPDSIFGSNISPDEDTGALLLDLSEHHVLFEWPSRQLLHAHGNKPVGRNASNSNETFLSKRHQKRIKCWNWGIHWWRRRVVEGLRRWTLARPAVSPGPCLTGTCLTGSCLTGTPAPAAWCWCSRISTTSHS